VRHGNPAEISVSVTSAPAEDLGSEHVNVEVANDGREINKSAGRAPLESPRFSGRAV
jgi:hypothetical protein